MSVRSSPSSELVEPERWVAAEDDGGVGAGDSGKEGEEEGV